MLRAIKVRLYPSKVQRTLFDKNIGCCRFVYNRMLATRREAYETTGKTVHKNDLIKMITPLKQQLEFAWLQEVDSQSLQQAVIDMDKAYQNFFKHGRGFPKFKKKSHVGSFRCTVGCRCDAKLKIGKHTPVKFRCSARDREILQNTKIRNITVSRDAGHYYASCLVDLSDVEYQGHPLEKVGIDVGVRKPLSLAFSVDGTLKFRTWGLHFSNNLASKEERRKKYQKAYSRKRAGSNNAKKARLRVARAYMKERNCRKEFVEQVSHRLTSTFAVINFEDLNLKGMTKSAKGTVEKPGKNVTAKSGLNRELLRIGIGALMLRTAQKAEQRGSIVNFINPKNTSRKCSCCGHTEKDNRKSQAVFKCVACGYTKNADYNAAKNVLRAA